MKSRFFSIPGLLVDVSEIVSVTYPLTDRNGVAEGECRVSFRQASSVYPDPGTAKAIAEYVEEYEAAMHDQWVNPLTVSAVLADAKA